MEKYHPVWNRDKETLAIANGAFDCIHVGHIRTLQFAKSNADKLLVAINSDASVRRLKGEGRPINSLTDRMELIAALECVDFVVSFDEDTPIKLINMIKPTFIVKGGDYRPEQVAGNEVAQVLIAPYIDGISTTNLVARIFKAEIHKAWKEDF